MLNYDGEQVSAAGVPVVLPGVVPSLTSPAPTVSRSRPQRLPLAFAHSVEEPAEHNCFPRICVAPIVPAAVAPFEIQWCAKHHTRARRRSAAW
jgi:hypothetical protein